MRLTNKCCAVIIQTVPVFAAVATASVHDVTRRTVSAMSAGGLTVHTVHLVITLCIRNVYVK